MLLIEIRMSVAPPPPVEAILLDPPLPPEYPPPLYPPGLDPFVLFEAPPAPPTTR